MSNFQYCSFKQGAALLKISPRKFIPSKYIPTIYGIYVVTRVYNREESIERRHTVHQMYAESNVTSCICHKLGICTLTNPSVGNVIYQESRLHHPHLDGLID